MPRTNSSGLQQLDILFETLSVPPPYSHRYTFQLRFSPDRLKVTYELQYTDREEVSEEEIWEEGFSPDDDIRWEGNLPAVWSTALREQWSVTQWVSPEEVRDRDNVENALVITSMLSDGSRQEGVPQPQEAWEYLLQELAQAVYEAAERELPLCIRYTERLGNEEKVFLSLTVNFLHRTVMVERKSGGGSQRYTRPWSTLELLFTLMYRLDYDTEKASPKLPRLPGKYLDPGDGLWYAFGKQVTNPGRANDLTELERLLSR